MGLYRWPIRRHVLVNLTDGRAFDALLVSKRGPLLVLANATLLESGAEAAHVDGHVYIERRHVAFIQDINGGG